MFETTDATEAGLVVGSALAMLMLLAANLYRYRVADAEARVYKLASRALLLLYGITVIAVVRAPTTYSPCFFGYSAITKSGVDVACDFAIAVSSIGAVVAVASLLLCLLAPYNTTAAWTDLFLALTSVPVWLVLGIYLAVQLQRRVDRCPPSAACESATAYPHAIAAVVFSFLSCMGWVLSLSDSFTSADSSKKIRPLARPVVEKWWALLRLAVHMSLTAIVLACIGDSQVFDDDGCWFGRDACQAVLNPAASGSFTFCNFGVGVPAISLLINLASLGFFVVIDPTRPAPWQAITHPLLALLWVVYASIMSLQRAVVCQSFFGSESACKSGNTSAYEKVTAAVVFAWLSAAWAIAVCADAYLREHARFASARRLGLGDTKRTRLAVLGLACAASVVQLGTTQYQQKDDTCFFARDSCSGSVEDVCRLSMGVASVSLASAVIIGVLICIDNIRVGKLMLLYVVPAGVMLPLTLACAVILANARDMTANNFPRHGRDLGGAFLSAIATLFAWLSSAAWFIFLGDVFVMFARSSPVQAHQTLPAPARFEEDHVLPPAPPAQSSNEALLHHTPSPMSSQMHARPLPTIPDTVASNSSMPPYGTSPPTQPSPYSETYGATGTAAAGTHPVYVNYYGFYDTYHQQGAAQAPPPGVAETQQQQQQQQELLHHYHESSPDAQPGAAAAAAATTSPDTSFHAVYSSPAPSSFQPLAPGSHAPPPYPYPDTISSHAAATTTTTNAYPPQSPEYTPHAENSASLVPASAPHAGETDVGGPLTEHLSHAAHELSERLRLARERRQGHDGSTIAGGGGGASQAYGEDETEYQNVDASGAVVRGLDDSVNDSSVA